MLQVKGISTVRLKATQILRLQAPQNDLHRAAKIHASDQVTNFTWTVQLFGFDLSYSNEFFLWVNPDGPDGFVSTYFNITEPTTSTINTATAATATSINTSNLAFPVSSASALATDSVGSSSASPAPSAGLTTTSKIALGVGIGIGLPALCALGALIWLRLRQDSKNNKNNNNKLTGPSSGTVAPYVVTGTQQRPSPSLYRPHDIDPKELHSSRFSSNNRFELPHSPYKWSYTRIFSWMTLSIGYEMTRICINDLLLKYLYMLIVERR